MNIDSSIPKNLAGLAKNLEITTSARIYKRHSQISDENMSALISKAAGKDAEVIEESIRARVEEFPDIYWSYVVFSRTRKVPFLRDADFKDTNHGFFLVIETDDTSFFFYSKSLFPDAIVDKYYRKLRSAEISQARLSGQIDLQKIRTKAMLNTFDGCHHRSFEGRNLQSRLGSRSNHRQIISSSTSKRGKRRSTVHFSLSKITDMGARSKIEEIARWVTQTTIDIAAAGDLDPFLQTYAQDCEFPTHIAIRGILLHSWEILEYFDESYGTISMARGGKRPTQEKIDHLIEVISAPITVVQDLDDPTVYRLFSEFDDEDEDPPTIGMLRVTNGSVKLNLRGSKAIIFTDVYDNDNSLHSILNTGGHFSIVFEDPSYYYSAGRTAKDADIIARTKILADIIHPIEDLGLPTCTSENGESSDGNRYPHESIFDILDETLSYHPDSVLICDDGTEWADFIEFSNFSSPEVIFYHAKWDDKIRRGATPFQEVIAQASKNLGFITRAPKIFLERFDTKWSGSRFGIPRLRSRNNSRLDSKGIVRKVLANPNLNRKVCIVVNFLSKEEFLSSIANTDELTDYQIQRIWLFNNLVSDCWDLGVTPEIICSP